MTKEDMKYGFLTETRRIGLVDDNINMVFLLVLWLLKFRIVFWILFVLFIINQITRGILINKIIKELKIL